MRKKNQQIMYKRILIRLSADFPAKTLQARNEWHTIFKVMNGRNITTKNTQLSKALIQIWQRKQKFYRQTKAKRIQHHQTSFTTNPKGTSLGGKEKPATRNKQKNYKWESLPRKANIKIGNHPHTNILKPAIMRSVQMQNIGNAL